MSNNPLQSFTVPARVVIVLCLVGALGGTAAFINLSWESIPAGSYPVWIFVMPALIAALVLCVSILALLHLCGVRIFQDDEPSQSEPDEKT